jgi:hypothetical protein
MLHSTELNRMMFMCGEVERLWGKATYFKTNWQSNKKYLKIVGQINCYSLQNL